MRLALGADVTVTGKSTFMNLADVEHPSQSLVGIAQSASQGAITARQLEARPLLRAGEVLETVSGVAATQHSGEGKANQYFLRGFNRRRLGTIREDRVVQTSAGAYVQHETEWGPWLRTLTGLRADGYRFAVDAGEPVRLPPPSGCCASPQSSSSSANAGTTEAGRPSHRQGLELSAYYSPLPWLTLDADASLARARFRDDHPDGRFVPGAVERVLSAGAMVDGERALFGGVRLRHFGPRALREDGGVRSAASSLINLSAGYRLTGSAKAVVDVFNLLDARHSDIDYFYVSRLPGEPESGIGDVHFHPALPRAARASLVIAF